MLYLPKPVSPVRQLGHPLARGLVGAWLFSAGAGTTVADLSGNGMTGTFAGATLPAWGSGIAGWSLTFNGSTAYIPLFANTAPASLPSALASIAASGTAYSFAGWIKTTASTSIGATAPWACGVTLIEARSTGNPASGHAWSWGTEGGKLCTARTSVFTVLTDTVRVNSTTSVNDGVWRHVVTTIDANTVTHYIDGKLDVTGTFSGSAIGDCSVATSVSNVYSQIGARTTNAAAIANWWSSTLDGLMVWSRALPADQVRQLYIDQWAAFRVPARPWLFQPAAVNFSLVAVTATGATGSVVPKLDISPASVAATGAAGSLVPSELISLVAVSGSGAAGTLGPSDLISLTGVLGTGEAGTLDLSNLTPLVAVSGTGEAGTLDPADLIQLAGVLGTGEAGIFGPLLLIPLGDVFGVGDAGMFDVPGVVGLVGVSGEGEAGAFDLSLLASLTGISGTGAAGAIGPALLISLTGASASGAVAPLLPGNLPVTVPLIGVFATGATGILTPLIIYPVQPNGRWRAVPSAAYLHLPNARTDLSPVVNEGGFTLFFAIPLSPPPEVGQFWSLIFTAPSGRSFATQGIYYGQDPVAGYLIPQRTYLAHVSLPDEFDEVGLWSVYAAAPGRWQSDYGYFRVLKG